MANQIFHVISVLIGALTCGAALVMILALAWLGTARACAAWAKEYRKYRGPSESNIYWHQKP